MKKTRITNISEVSRRFAWVPKHGLTLDAGESVTLNVAALVFRKAHKAAQMQDDIDNGYAKVESIDVETAKTTPITTAPIKAKKGSKKKPAAVVMDATGAGDIVISNAPGDVVANATGDNNSTSTLNTTIVGTDDDDNLPAFVTSVDHEEQLDVVDSQGNVVEESAAITITGDVLSKEATEMPDPFAGIETPDMAEDTSAEPDEEIPVETDSVDETSDVESIPGMSVVEEQAVDEVVYTKTALKKKSIEELRTIATERGLGFDPLSATKKILSDLILGAQK
jgi:hypothetical protein